MTTTNLMPVLTFAVLGLYFTNFFTFANAHSGCVPSPISCRISWNVTTNVTVRHDKVQQINATLKAVAEATVEEECRSAIRNLMCISATLGCNNTNSSSQMSVASNSSQECMTVERNCTEVVSKTYGSMYCSQIHGYNDSQCVEVTVANSGYCPNSDTYKIRAVNITEFLRKASVESEKLQTMQVGNISNECLTEYKRIKCRTLVPICEDTNNITKQSCEQKLQCLPPNFSSDKANVCSNFPSEPPIPTTMPTVATTPYDFTTGFNTTVTVRLNEQFNADYSNKSSSLYQSFVNDVTDGLKIAYKEIAGFQGVFVMELICQKEVAVKHTVVTSLKRNVKVMEARLILANFTMGYLQGKVVEPNKACVDDRDNVDNDDHVDDNNWVYMIVFVCVTALLLLAMVLCHQSK